MPAVHCGFAPRINWVEYTGGVKSQGVIHLWRMHLPAALSNIDQAASILSVDEMERANRYFQEKDRMRFMLSRAMLRTVLGRYANAKPQDIKFAVTPDKKPYVPESKMQFNISHSGDLVVVSISDVPVGIDVEIVDAAFEYSDVLPSIFGAEEIDDIVQGGRERFYKYWTRKECLVKALGKGMDEHTPLLPCLDGVYIVSAAQTGIVADWMVSSFDAHAGYMSSVAYPAPGKEIAGFDFYF